MTDRPAAERQSEREGLRKYDMSTSAMHHVRAVLLFLSTLSPQLSTAFAQGTAFTYQGRLNDGANPASGIYDFQFALYNAATDGTQQGSTLAADNLPVTNGLFTVVLDLTGTPFDGSARWLQIRVRPGASSGSYSNLLPRQPITATPYAVRAATAASAASVSAANITGTIPLARLPVAVVTNGASGLNLSGTFSGNGAGVTNVALEALNSHGFISWGYFVLSSSPVVGNRPRSVTAADVNGDGNMDLISANAGADTLTVLTNNGGGGFMFSSSPAVDRSPFFVSAADVNGDGKLDLISANNPSRTLTVVTNNGVGSFALASSPAVDTGPFSFTAADVNGDGKVDLISANFFANTLTVLLNSPLYQGYFAGNVSAANISGTLADDRLSANVALLGANQTFTGQNIFNNARGIFSGAFSGDGLGLYNLNADKVITGTLDDARLSGNVALLNRSQTFTGNNSFGNITLNPPSELSFGASTRQMLNLWGSAYGIGVQADTLYYRSAHQFVWYQGGMHADGSGDSGGGARLMYLHPTVGLVLERGMYQGSDRNAKTNVAAVDPAVVLRKVIQLPISSWSYRDDLQSMHIGPMAQDFHAAFGLGPDDKHIATVDADGVALAAIQGLNQKLEDRLQQKATEITELKQAVAELKGLVSKLAGQQKGDAH